MKRHLKYSLKKERISLHISHVVSLPCSVNVIECMSHSSYFIFSCHSFISFLNSNLGHYYNTVILVTICEFKKRRVCRTMHRTGDYYRHDVQDNLIVVKRRK